jgi:ParB/RepB/Spo0J family partition protein
MEQQLKTLPLSEIIDHPQNVMIYGDGATHDLIESIHQNGVINPVVVFYDSSRLCFVCLSGHRRRGAAAAAGLTEIPAIVMADDLNEWQQLRVIVEANRASPSDWHGGGGTRKGRKKDQSRPCES